MPDRGWSALFFLDEAVALTAGHRPCHYCRRDAYRAWTAAWARATGAPPDRMAMDSALHHARVTRTRQQVRHQAECDTLPDYSFILWNDRAHMVHNDALHPYTPDGYGTPVPRPKGKVTVLTPAPTVNVLAAGYMPVRHPSVEV